MPNFEHASDTSHKGVGERDTFKRARERLPRGIVGLSSSMGVRVWR